jgi:hypothetical protein
MSQLGKTCRSVRAGQMEARQGIALALFRVTPIWVPIICVGTKSTTVGKSMRGRSAVGCLRFHSTTALASDAPNRKALDMGTACLA